MEEIMSEKENKTIVFVETKRRCDDLTRKMRRDGWVVAGTSLSNSLVCGLDTTVKNQNCQGQQLSATMPRLEFAWIPIFD